MKKYCLLVGILLLAFAVHVEPAVGAGILGFYLIHLGTPGKRGVGGF